MAKSNFNDLLAFVTVAREGSFTRAAVQPGVTQSAVSQVVCTGSAAENSLAYPHDAQRIVNGGGRAIAGSGGPSL